MRIVESPEQPLAAFQRATDARLAEAHRARERGPVAVPGRADPAVPLADAVTLSPEARAAYARHLREPSDLAHLVHLLREALRGPAAGRSAALAALRAALLAAGAPAGDLPARPAELARLPSLVPAAFPAADDESVAHLGAWLLAGRANADAEPPPALLAFLGEWRERRRPPRRRCQQRRPPSER